jgi:pimeloyl-ACP methyl ester carboxylesterase
MNLADGFPRYADIERRLATLPVISVPTITMDGDADGVIAATDGKSSAARFTQRVHRVVPGVGHNLPQEAPAPFADAVWELVAAQR